MEVIFAVGMVGTQMHVIQHPFKLKQNSLMEGIIREIIAVMLAVLACSDAKEDRREGAALQTDQ